MRLSCNGCRVLRKGCTDACTIRPCLQWIKSPDAQANATVFLAKFYGRAGLLNLIAAAPSDALRPAVFRSLLYEACGRIVSPVYGAVGLLWNGTWHMCQAAVEAVLKGAPIVVVDDAGAGAPPIKGFNAAAAAAAYDVRHVFPKSSSSSSSSSNKQWSPAAHPPPPPPAAAAQAQSKDDEDQHTGSRLLHLQRVVSVSKPKFKRTSSSSASKKTKQPQPHLDAASPATEHHNGDDAMLVADQDHHSDAAVRQASNSNHHSASLDTEEEAASHVSQAVAEQPEDHQAEQPPPSMALDLTLGLSAAPPTPVDQPAGVIAFRFL